jgi:hypothetical protein
MKIKDPTEIYQTEYHEPTKIISTNESVSFLYEDITTAPDPTQYIKLDRDLWDYIPTNAHVLYTVNHQLTTNTTPNLQNYISVQSTQSAQNAQIYYGGYVKNNYFKIPDCEEAQLEQTYKNATKTPNDHKYIILANRGTKPYSLATINYKSIGDLWKLIDKRLMIEFHAIRCSLAQKTIDLDEEREARHLLEIRFDAAEQSISDLKLVLTAMSNQMTKIQTQNIDLNMRLKKL